MSAPGETAPATLPADWQAMADRTGRPFADGGAYASDMFADWAGCVAVLHGYGFTLHGAERFLRSKHMRWCADESSEGYGGAMVAELTEYLGDDSSQWRRDFSMAPESVTASGEAAGPDAAADISGDAMASLAHVAALRADAERERDAAIARVKVAEARALAAERERECDRLRDRERSIIDACERVADGGQYRADIIGAIERIREDRDAAIAQAEKAEIIAAPLMLRQKAIASIAARGGEEDWDDVGWMIDDAIARAHLAVADGRDVDEAWEEWARNAGASQESADDVEPVFRASFAALRALGVEP